MPLFRRRHGTSMHDIDAGVPGLAALARSRGWQPAAGNPLPGALADVVGDGLRAMYGHPRGMSTNERSLVRVGDTLFRDSFRTDVDGRRVIVTNAWKNIQGEIKGAQDELRGVAVCAVELPSMLPIVCIQPRRFRRVGLGPELPTGDAAFDDAYVVVGRPPLEPGAVVTPAMMQRIAMRDDWAFLGHRAWLACISLGAFGSADDVTERIDDVLGIVAAIPTTVMPDHIDHTGDDLIERATKLQSIDEAMAFLQNLTDDERNRLRSSSSPLAAMADAHTPAEAMARFKDLDDQQKLEILAMVQRAKG